MITDWDAAQCLLVGALLNIEHAKCSQSYMLVSLHSLHHLFFLCIWGGLDKFRHSKKSCGFFFSSAYLSKSLTLEWMRTLNAVEHRSKPKRLAPMAGLPERAVPENIHRLAWKRLAEMLITRLSPCLINMSVKNHGCYKCRIAFATIATARVPYYISQKSPYPHSAYSNIKIYNSGNDIFSSWTARLEVCRTI